MSDNLPAERDNGYVLLPRVQPFTKWAKGDRPAQLKAAGVEVGDFYLQDALGPRAVKPFRIFITTNIFRYHQQTDSNGKPVEIRERSEAWRPERGDGWKDATTAIVLVSTAGELIPAVFTSNNAIDRLWNNIVAASRQAARTTAEQYAKRGGSAVHAAQAAEFYGRFTANIYTTEESKQDKPKDTYVLGHSVIGVPTADEVRLFNHLHSSGELASLTAVFAKMKQKLVDLQVSDEEEA